MGELSGIFQLVHLGDHLGLDTDEAALLNILQRIREDVQEYLLHSFSVDTDIEILLNLQLIVLISLRKFGAKLGGHRAFTITKHRKFLNSMLVAKRTILK